MIYRNPPTAVDIIIEMYNANKLNGIVLVRRKNPPYKGQWALPGGFQEVGESLEQTAVRESKEETNLDIKLQEALPVFSNPDRDPRGHVNSIGFIASSYEYPKGGDDASEAKVFPLENIPYPLAFDHDERIRQYECWKKGEKWQDS